MSKDGTIIIQAMDDGIRAPDPDLDAVDIFYVLERHGWSSCYLYVNKKTHFMGPTHIWGSPLDVLADGMAEFLAGTNKVNFTWYDEPGTYDWFINRDEDQHHVMDVTINMYADEEHNLKIEPPKSDLYETIKFKVKTKHFTTCLLKQFEKIETLMCENSYRIGREGEFDQATLARFKKAYHDKYGT